MSQILSVLLWNACLAAGLAVVVFLAQRIWRLRFHPNLWHALWLLVLLKLATPPIFSVPVSVESIRTERYQNDHLVSTLPLAGQTLSFKGEGDATLLTKMTDTILTPRFAVATSAFGTVALLLLSLSRVRQIGRLVRHAEPAPQWMQDAAVTAARQLDLRRVPLIRTVGGILAPFLWAAPRGPVVVMPGWLVEGLEPDSVRLIIKHELAHYARRDHWTNSFAMIIGALFWWNPVVWWARRELRVLQESCCDVMVLADDTSQRHRYAEALLKTIDFVASDDAALPSPATAFASCATFKRRIEMIVSETQNRVHSRRLQACVLLCAMVVLPIGVTYAQDYEAVGKRLRAAVEAGELTGGQARVMLGALKKADGDKKDQGSDRAKAYLANVKKELGAAVEAGEISKEDAIKRYQGAEKAIKARMARARGERSITVEEYKSAEAKMRKMVEDGTAKPEDVERRLIEMRKMMAGQGERKRGERSITVEEYRSAEAKMRKMVEDGTAKPEDVERRLIEMRKMMAGQGER